MLSVLTQEAAEVEVAFRVSELFPPRPTVGSAVVHLKNQRPGWSRSGSVL